jgi:hypothetical protein
MNLNRAHRSRLAIVLPEYPNCQRCRFKEAFCLNFHGVAQSLSIQVRNNARRHAGGV